MKVRVGILVVLAFLSLTVVAYDYQFCNIPSSVFLNAYNLAQKRATEFRITLPSAGIPQEYRDVTDDSDFQVQVLAYVIASDTVRYPIQIPEHSSAEWWLKHASNSSEYDMTIKYLDNDYFLQVRYEPNFYRTSLEYTILWTISIVTAIAWTLFLADLLVSHGKKLPPSERKMEG